ncbi:hypothetical protein C8Q74DRAFT_376723 [Fomes fomentarius]|nr:hypothetical protein C8Q74DRAFT_376723 [Fomes fomentarius]
MYCHRFVREVIALGPSFCPDATPRCTQPSALAIRSFTESVSCGECHLCRIGFPCRCIHSCILASQSIPTIPGGQAQYIPVPKAGGTLCVVRLVMAFFLILR